MLRALSFKNLSYDIFLKSICLYIKPLQELGGKRKNNRHFILKHKGNVDLGLVQVNFYLGDKSIFHRFVTWLLKHI